MSRMILLVIGLSVAWPLSSARAHFLFIQLGPHAESGRTAEVFFSERATAGDPKFVGKIAHTELWRQDEPGKFESLMVNRGTDRLRAAVSSSGTVSVTGKCEYGVLKREKSFLLRYYPKAVSGKSEEIASLRRHEAIPLEIMPSFARDTVTFTVLKDGKPVPEALLTTVDADLANEELKTDQAGQVTWKISGAAPYAVYVKSVINQSGAAQGAPYDEIREFATLGFDWPVDQSRVDKDAVALFEQAIAARAGWKDFKGFSCDVETYLDGRRHEGRISVKADGQVSFVTGTIVDDEAARDWVSDQFRSLVTHRVPTSGLRSEPLLSFADAETNHPLGRLLIFHGGRFASTYRVRGDEIVVVNRNLGRESMSLQMQESERNPEGKVLPRAYLVQYRDAGTGAITRVETTRSRWQRVGAIDLPETLEQSVSTQGGFSVRSLKLKSIVLATETLETDKASGGSPAKSPR